MNFLALVLIQHLGLQTPPLAPNGAQKVGVVLLAGGSGSRMKADRPKQFLQLANKPVLAHSIQILRRVRNLHSLVIVLADEARTWDFVQQAVDHDPLVSFADPGKERQDSVENGLAQIGAECTLVAVHDSARPLVTLDAIHACIADASEHGAAVLAVPMKATVKEATADGAFVKETLDRSKLWEIQTPQVMRPELLREGFAKVRAEKLEVTDDVSIVEALGHPVKLTMGEYTNLKLTTPEDMVIAEQILAERAG